MSESVPVEMLGQISVHGESNVLLRRRNRTLLVLSVVTFSVTWLIAAVLGVPVERGFDGSLLVQPSFFAGLIALFAAAVSIGLNTLILRAVLGRLFGLEIMFSVAVGLLAFSVRGGSMVQLLQYHGGGINIALIVETVLIFAGLAAVWPVLRPASDEGVSDLQSKGTALGVVVVVMVILMHILCQSPSKKQAIFSVGIAAFAGATAAFSFLGEMSVEPYLLAPLVVALLGYVLALFGGTLPTGQPTQVLAFPLPLDYAGAGIAGTLLGYWTGLGWKQENERDAA